MVMGEGDLIMRGVESQPRGNPCQCKVGLGVGKPIGKLLRQLHRFPSM